MKGLGTCSRGATVPMVRSRSEEHCTGMARRTSLLRVGPSCRGLLAAGVVGLLVAGVPAQALGQTPAAVTGTVVDEWGRPRGAADVVLERWPHDFAQARADLAGRASSLVGEAVDRTTADETGAYRLVAPEAGLYRLRLTSSTRHSAATTIYAALVPLVAPSVLDPIELPDLQPLRVVALDSVGQPVEGASVRVSFQNDSTGPSLSEPDRRTARHNPVFGHAFGRTDSDGMARFGIPDTGSSLLASAPGFGMVAREVAAGSVGLRLVREAPIRFRVLGVDDQPTPGVLIRARRAGRATLALTGENGVALVNGFSDRATTFLFLAPNGAFGEMRLPPSTDSTDVRDRDVRLEAPYLLAGRVVDVATGEAVPRALVWPDAVPGLYVRTDASGVFDLSVGSDGYTATLLLAASGYASPMRVTTARLADAPGAALGLVPAAVVGGLVVDESASPVGGAVARVEPVGGTISSRHADSRRTTTGADGRFWIESVPYDSAYELTVEAEGYARASERRTGIERGVATEDVRIVLEFGRSVRGCVVDATGAPVAGAMVRLLAPLEEPELGVTFLDHDVAQSVVSRSDGGFEFLRVVGSRATLLIEHQEHPVLATELDLHPQHNGTDLGIFSMAPGLVIEGQVVDADGRPVVGASVTAAQVTDVPGYRDRMDVTDEDGRFRLGGLLPTLADLSVSAEGFGPVAAPGVRPGTDEPTRIELSAAGVVLGRVVDETGGPLNGVSVLLAAEDVSSGLSWNHVVFGCKTADDGSFRFDALGPGRWVAEARSHMGASAEESVEVLPGETAEMELRLRRRDVLTVAVSNQLGMPLSGAEVMVTPAGRAARREFGVTDASGRVSLAVRPGEVLVSGRSRNMPVTSRRLMVEPGHNDLSLRLEPGWKISGVVLSEVGGAVGHAIVEAAVEAAVEEGEAPSPMYSAVQRMLVPPARTVAADDGSFELIGLEQGVYRLTARRQGSASAGADRTVQVDRRSIYGVDLVLAESVSTSGLVKGLGLDELGHVVVRASRERDSRLTMPDSQGRFTIGGMGAGEWRFSARSGGMGGRVATSVVQIEPPLPPPFVELAFDPGFRLRGEALFLDEPLSGAIVTARRLDGDYRRTTRADGRGGFTLDGLPAGLYDVTVWHARGSAKMAAVELEIDRDGLRVDIGLLRSGRE